MIIDSKIERYVHEVTRYIPLGERSQVGEELTLMIKDMVIDYAGNKKPDILDCKEVLQDLGTPEEVAEAYIETHEARRKAGREKGFFESKKGQLAQLVCTLISIVAAILVCVGIVGLGTHLISTMLPLFLGVILALGTGAGKVIIRYIHMPGKTWRKFF